MHLKKFSWLFGLAFLLNVFSVTFMSCSDDEAATKSGYTG